MTSREQFEAWAKRSTMSLEWIETEGRYDGPTADLAFRAWQAARSGMVPKGEVEFAWDEGFTAGRKPDGCMKAWEQSRAKRVMEGEE